MSRIVRQGAIDRFGARRPFEILVRELRSESPFVFSCVTSKSGHVIGIPATWRKVIARAEIENARLHDLRHNFASTAVGMNISRPKGALLGHRSMQSTQIYAHVAADPAHEASERVTAKFWQCSSPRADRG